MLILTDVAEPRWANIESTAINMLVQFQGLASPIPFTASPDDVEAHGRDIFARASSGEFGEVAPYEPPPAPTEEQLSAAAYARRAHLIEAATVVIGPLQDAVDLGETSSEGGEHLAAWKRYRLQLHRVVEQEGFPGEIVWPEAPEVP